MLRDVMPLSRVFAIAFFVLTVLNAVASPQSRTISSSRQFLIYGGDVPLGAPLCDAAERLQARLLSRLQVSDRWMVPILLNVTPREANTPERPTVGLQFSQTDVGLRIQLDLVIDAEVAPAVWGREISRALLLEMSYRRMAKLPVGSSYVLPPEWLVEAILTFDNEPPEVLDAFENIAAHPPSLRGVIEQQPALLDSQSHVLYCAAADTLLRLLLRDDNGRKGLVQYIADLPRSSTDAVAD